MYFDFKNKSYLGLEKIVFVSGAYTGFCKLVAPPPLAVFCPCTLLE